MERQGWKRLLCCFLLLLMLLPAGSALAEESASARWADAADEIDKYLDAAFEAFLDGDAQTAYCVLLNMVQTIYGMFPQRL